MDAVCGTRGMEFLPRRTVGYGRQSSRLAVLLCRGSGLGTGTVRMELLRDRSRYRSTTPESSGCRLRRVWTVDDRWIVGVALESNAAPSHVAESCQSQSHLVQLRNRALDHDDSSVCRVEGGLGSGIGRLSRKRNGGDRAGDRALP